MPSSDAQFEATLADLAFNSLREKAPALFDYLVGFQVLDVNDEQTKAVGMFGCRVGPEWVLIPVFFLNGEFKGGLMYLKNQDSFVPLQENWVSYILSRRPYSLGSGTDTNRSDIAKHAPDLTSFYRSPSIMAKTAELATTTRADFYRSNIPCWSRANAQPWAVPLLETVSRPLEIGPMAEAFSKSAGRIDLRRLAREHGPGIQQGLEQLMEKSAEFGDALVRFYGQEPIAPEAYAARLDLTKFAAVTAPEGVGDVDVVSFASVSDNPVDLSDAEKTDLLKGKIVVRDRRKETSTLYEGDLSRALENPHETGVYDVFLRNRGFARALVAIHPLHADGAGGSYRSLVVMLDEDGDDGIRKDDPCCIVPVGDGNKSKAEADIDDGRNYVAVLPRQVFARDTPDQPTLWVNLYRKAKSLDSVREGKAYVFLTPDRRVSEPFIIRHKKEGLEGATDLWVAEASYNRGRDPVFIDHADLSLHQRPSWSDSGPRGHHVLLTGKPGTMIRLADTLYVPKSARVIAVAPGKASPDLGDAGDVHNLLVQTTRVGPIKVYATRDEYVISSKLAPEASMSKSAAVRHLVCDHGLTGPAAFALLDSVKPFSHQRAYVSYAGSYPRMEKVAKPTLNGEDSYAPLVDAQPSSLSVNGTPAELPTRTVTPIQPLLAANNDSSIYRDDLPQFDPRQLATAAAKSGQKEVFDAAAIGSLIRVIDAGSLVDQYLGDIARGLDRTGRILFLLYQHAEDFTERYGQEDMQELEDTLRNNFKGQGDLVLFLRQRTTDERPEMNRTEVDLTPSAS
jgi:hypothetical protein